MNAKTLIIGIVLGILVTVSLGARSVTPFATEQFIPMTTASGELVLVDLVTATARYVELENSSVPSKVVRPR